jgi:hypothetical protein
MVAYSSTLSVSSKLYPGVTFTVRRITEEIRNRFRLELAEPLYDLREKRMELSLIKLPEGKDTVVDPEIEFKVSGLIDKIRIINATRINSVYARAGFVKLEGMSIDGDESPSLDVIMSKGPEDLFNEIVSKIVSLARLDEEAAENLESPTTSAAEAGGLMKDSSAEPAKLAVTT